MLKHENKIIPINQQFVLSTKTWKTFQ